MLAKCGEPLGLTLAMDSSLFLRKCTCRRMAANGLGIILFRYADWLHAKGYSRHTIQLYTQAVEHFGFWRAKHHPGSQTFSVLRLPSFCNPTCRDVTAPRRLRRAFKPAKAPSIGSWRCLVAGTPRRSHAKVRGRSERWLLILISTWRRYADSVRRPGSIDGAMRGSSWSGVLRAKDGI
jgi:hypothetical protein